MAPPPHRVDRAPADPVHRGDLVAVAVGDPHPPERRSDPLRSVPGRFPPPRGRRFDLGGGRHQRPTRSRQPPDDPALDPIGRGHPAASSTVTRPRRDRQRMRRAERAARGRGGRRLPWRHRDLHALVGGPRAPAGDRGDRGGRTAPRHQCRATSTAPRFPIAPGPAGSVPPGVRHRRRRLRIPARSIAPATPGRWRPRLRGPRHDPRERAPICPPQAPGRVRPPVRPSLRSSPRRPSGARASRAWAVPASRASAAAAARDGLPAPRPPDRPRGSRRGMPRDRAAQDQMPTWGCLVSRCRRGRCPVLCGGYTKPRAGGSDAAAAMPARAPRPRG